jgi:hypothetical protein
MKGIEMKKKLLALFVATAIGSISQAAVKVDWYNLDAVKDVDLSDLAMGGSYTFWLIQTPGSAILFDTSALTPGLGETVVGSFDWATSTAVYDAGLFYEVIQPGALAPGFGPIGDIGLGSYLYTAVTGAGGVYGLPDSGVATLVDASNYNAGAQFLNYDTGAITLIPEPSVMALMGLGGLLMAIRRRRMIA